jgi:hypothetical protein
MGDVCCYVQEYNQTLLIHHLGTTCYKLHFFVASTFSPLTLNMLIVVLFP